MQVQEGGMPLFLFSAKNRSHSDKDREIEGVKHAMVGRRGIVAHRAGEWLCPVVERDIAHRKHRLAAHRARAAFYALTEHGPPGEHILFL